MAEQALCSNFGMLAVNVSAGHLPHRCTHTDNHYYRQDLTSYCKNPYYQSVHFYGQAQI